MALIQYLNFGGTILAFGTVSFAASNFGVKLGRVSVFNNNTGYKYISQAPSDKVDKLYGEMVKVAKKNPKAPQWAQNLKDLKKWCKSNERSLRKWSEASQYCLIQNTVRHKLIELEDDFSFKEIKQIEPAQPESTESENNTEKCTDNLLNSYADGKESIYYMLGKKYCKFEAPQQPAVPVS